MYWKILDTEILLRIPSVLEYGWYTEIYTAYTEILLWLFLSMDTFRTNSSLFVSINSVDRLLGACENM